MRLQQRRRPRSPRLRYRTNVAATLHAKDLGCFRILNATPHGATLMELDEALIAFHVARLTAGFATLLAQRRRQAVREGADLTAFDGAEGFATFLAAAGSGLKHEARTEAVFRSAINRLARVLARAAGQS